MGGWRIVPGSGEFVLVEHIEGDENHDWYNKGLQNETGTGISWRARTEHKAGGHSGKIKWAIKCKVARNVVETTMQPDDVPMTWAMSKVFPYPAGKWKAIWTSFDGRPREYNSTNLEHAMFQINATGDSLTVKTFDSAQ
jgi:hypothetical protein